MEDDLDPAYDRETAVADLTRISAWIVAAPDRRLASGINREDCMGMAADLNQVIAYITHLARVNAEMMED